MNIVWRFPLKTVMLVLTVTTSISSLTFLHFKSTILHLIMVKIMGVISLVFDQNCEVLMYHVKQHALCWDAFLNTKLFSNTHYLICSKPEWLDVISVDGIKGKTGYSFCLLLSPLRWGRGDCPSRRKHYFLSWVCVPRNIPTPQGQRVRGSWVNVCSFAVVLCVVESLV